MNWQRLIPRFLRPDTPPRPGNGLAAHRALIEAQDRLERDLMRVDRYTEEVKRLLGGAK